MKKSQLVRAIAIIILAISHVLLNSCSSNNDERNDIKDIFKRFFIVFRIRLSYLFLVGIYHYTVTQVCCYSHTNFQ